MYCITQFCCSSLASITSYAKPPTHLFSPRDPPTLRHTSTETYTATSTRLATRRRPIGHPEGAKGLKPVSAHTQDTQQCGDSWEVIESAKRHYVSRISLQPELPVYSLPSQSSTSQKQPAPTYIRLWGLRSARADLPTCTDLSLIHI